MVSTSDWYLWLLTQSAEPTVSVRIDYMLERVSSGKADVWTGEVGEQGYSMGGINPLVVFNAVLDTICPPSSNDKHRLAEVTPKKRKLPEDGQTASTLSPRFIGDVD